MTKNKAVTDANALAAAKDSQEARQKELEQKQRKAHLLRVDYVLGLAELGLEEHLVLDYQPTAVVPTIRLSELTEEQKKKIHEDLAKYKSDLQAMGSGIVVP